MKIYLCSRIADDARPLNNQVASQLRALGYDVYVPHEQKPNNPSPEDKAEGRWDVETIFKLDHGAMKESDVCVVVGRVGVDCSFEVGWFYGRGLPIFYVSGGDESFRRSPMLIPALTENQHTVDTIAGAVMRFDNAY